MNIALSSCFMLYKEVKATDCFLFPQVSEYETLWCIYVYHSEQVGFFYWIFTARVRSTTGGYIFSLFVSPQGEG